MGEQTRVERAAVITPNGGVFPYWKKSDAERMLGHYQPGSRVAMVREWTEADAAEYAEFERWKSRPVAGSDTPPPLKVGDVVDGTKPGELARIPVGAETVYTDRHGSYNTQRTTGLCFETDTSVLQGSYGLHRIVALPPGYGEAEGKDAMVRIEVTVDGESGHVIIPEADAKHVCGSHGFGQGDDDRCPRCEADIEATQKAIDKLHALRSPPPTPTEPIRWKDHDSDIYELRDDGVYWLRADGPVKQDSPTGTREEMIAWMDADFSRIPPTPPAPIESVEDSRTVANRVRRVIEEGGDYGPSKITSPEYSNSQHRVENIIRAAIESRDGAIRAEERRRCEEELERVSKEAAVLNGQLQMANEDYEMASTERNELRSRLAELEAKLADEKKASDGYAKEIARMLEQSRLAQSGEGGDLDRLNDHINTAMQQGTDTDAAIGALCSALAIVRDRLAAAAKGGA